MCDILGLTNPSVAVSSLDDDEKTTISRPYLGLNPRKTHDNHQRTHPVQPNLQVTQNCSTGLKLWVTQLFPGFPKQDIQPLLAPPVKSHIFSFPVLDQLSLLHLINELLKGIFGVITEEPTLTPLLLVTPLEKFRRVRKLIRDRILPTATG